MSLLAHAPTFGVDDAVRLAREIYGLQADATPLPSERDQNFLLQTPSGERFVLKIANALEERALLDAQQRAMWLVANRTSLCPRVLPTLSGDVLAETHLPSGARHFVRLVTYLNGVSVGRLRRRSAELRCDIGRRVGQLDRALLEFEHPAAHREFHWELGNGVDVCREYLPLVADESLRRTVAALVAGFERVVSPLLPELRTSVVHNDANDHNLIVDDGRDLQVRHRRVTGVIDFGDLVYSYTVGDLAIAAAYAALDERYPLAAAADVVRGYHSELPLEDTEIAALFGLLCLRLCTSVCVAAHQLSHRPGDEYLSISQAGIRRTLPALARTHPRLAEATFRHACGLPAVPASHQVRNLLAAQAGKFAPLLGDGLEAARSVVIDLGVGSPLVSGDERDNAEPRITPRILGAMSEAGAAVGILLYGEARSLYSSNAFSTGDSPADERRTVHLGIDLFAEPLTGVHAPMDGEVHAFANNASLQDYGPVIILRHEAGGGAPFYTLYGHLSLQSLDGMAVGRRIAKGERFAEIGTAEENGAWTPHLHFQVIVDLLGLDCDFPGVARPSQQEIWRSFSPDPSPMLRIPSGLLPPPAPSAAETLATRRRRLGPNLSLAYREPLKVVRGWMQYVYDDGARRYLDAYNNVPHVGHCHPKVVRAAHEQMSTLSTNTRYLHDSVNRFAEQLCATLPQPLSVCFFVNSGSEANELALRLARAHTARRDMIVLESAYHGNTTTLIDISPYKHDGPGGAGAPEWVHTVPVPDVYRGAYRRDDPRAGEKYAWHVLDVIERLAERGTGPAGYIAESLPSVGGQIVFPEGYLAAVYRHVRAAGGVCIADEVQTAYGRIGTHFWGFEPQGVVPDIVVLGKPIGNGHPIGAVVTTPEIAASFDTGMEFFSTFGGNTVSSAVGLAVLDVVREEGLMAHAREVGERMLEALWPLARWCPLVGDVRGSGLFLGVELVRDRETLEPAGDEASFVANRMREEGILIGTDGPFHNVLKIRPPMPFSASDADFLVETLERILVEEFGD